MNESQRFRLVRIICSAALFFTGMTFKLSIPFLEPYTVYLFAFSAIIVGYDVLLDALNGIIHGHMLDENFLMSVGSICAFVLGEYPEGTVILLLYQVGELFQSVAVRRSRNSIAELMDISPDEARRENGEVVDPFEITIGEIILIEPGEKIPLDGIIFSGNSSIDTSSLTGESVPREVSVGYEVISGSINLTSPIKVKVTKEFSESTVTKILELVENASSKKAKLESFVTRFAKYYTPIVVISALLVASIPPMLFSLDFKTWIIRAVMFIVISCPCALVVSVPLSFFGALGAASKSGILIKGSNYLESLRNIDTVILDKTGTVTEGSFSITEIHTAQDIEEDELKRCAVICEYHSSHPIALSIKKKFSIIALPESDMEYEIIAGKGVIVRQNERLLLAGNRELLSNFGINTEKTPDGVTAVHLADERYLGYILLSDKIKPSTPEALSALKKSGIEKIVMLSGDLEGSVRSVAKSLPIDEYYYELLPHDKVKIAEKILSESDKLVAFVGDGVNDAPVLARADIGIAMGALGSDAAIEAADIVIMNDDLTLISKAIEISKKAVRISKQNIYISLIIKFSQLFLSLVGLGTIWMAVFADVGVLIIAIANSMRTLRKK